MDNIIDVLNNAYQAFIGAAASALEAKETFGGQKTLATIASLENFKHQWELFRVACDKGEEFVESLKLRLGSECLVDEATWATTTGLQPVRAVAVHLEQMTKAVRLLVFELHQGSGTAASGNLVRKVMILECLITCSKLAKRGQDTQLNASGVKK